jgi:hypothetical protein
MQKKERYGDEKAGRYLPYALAISVVLRKIETTTMHIIIRK